MKPLPILRRIALASLCLALLLVVLHFLLVPRASARGLEDAVLALHVQAHTEKAALRCEASPTEGDIACSSYNTQGSLRQPLDVYLIVARADTGGISGVTFGIDYEGGGAGEGLRILDWIYCTSGYEFPSNGWPAPATGNIVTWVAPDACAETFIGPDGIHGLVGSFYVYAYSEDVLRIREHPLVQNDERLAVANCAGAVRRLDKDAGITAAAGFTENPWACNPCSAPCIVPVQPSTWGRIKTRYRRP